MATLYSSIEDDTDAQNKVFLLQREAKKLTISATDVSGSRIAAIFQLHEGGLYLEDEITSETFFPTSRSEFNPANMRDKGSLVVCGNPIAQALSTNTPSVTGGFPNIQPSATVTGPGFGSHGQHCARQGPSASFRSHGGALAFIPPQRKQRILRKQILIADSDEGHLQVFTSVHVKLTEGMGVTRYRKPFSEVKETHTVGNISTDVIQEMVDSLEVNLKIDTQALKESFRTDIQTSVDEHIESVSNVKSSLVTMNRRLDVLDQIAEKLTGVCISFPSTGIQHCFPEMLMRIPSLAFCQLVVLFVPTEPTKFRPSVGSESCFRCPFNVCNAGEYTNLDKLFPGLFVDIKPFSKKINPIRDQDISIISSFNVLEPEVNYPTFKPSSGSCCEIKQQFPVPETVVFKNRNYTVSHYEQSYQVVACGVCRYRRSNCCMTCIQQFSYQWILIEDDAVAYQPAVRFVPVKFPSHCRCANLRQSVLPWLHKTGFSEE
ncbi:hypothetical protein ScPMuIL_015834 [Solemya velum]